MTDKTKLLFDRLVATLNPEQVFREYTETELTNLVDVLRQIDQLITPELFWAIEDSVWNRLISSLTEIQNILMTSIFPIDEEYKDIYILFSKAVKPIENTIGLIQDVMRTELRGAAEKFIYGVDDINRLVERDPQVLYIGLQVWLTEKGEDGKFTPDPVGRLGIKAIANLIPRLSGQIYILIDGGHPETSGGENIAQVYERAINEVVSEKARERVKVIVQSRHPMAMDSSGETRFFLREIVKHFREGETKGDLLVLCADLHRPRIKTLTATIIAGKMSDEYVNNIDVVSYEGGSLASSTVGDVHSLIRQLRTQKEVIQVNGIRKRLYHMAVNNFTRIIDRKGLILRFIAEHSGDKKQKIVVAAHEG